MKELTTITEWINNYRTSTLLKNRIYSTISIRAKSLMFLARLRPSSSIMTILLQTPTSNLSTQTSSSILSMGLRIISSSTQVPITNRFNTFLRINVRTTKDREYKVSQSWTITDLMIKLKKWSCLMRPWTSTKVIIITSACLMMRKSEIYSETIHVSIKVTKMLS